MGNSEAQVNINFIKKRLLFFGGMLIFGGLFIIVYLAANDNKLQIFTDIVNEYTAIYSSNKSAERNLAYLLSLLGAAVYFIFFFFSNHNNEVIHLISENEDEKKTLFIVLPILIYTSIYYFIYLGTNCLLIISAVYVLCLFVLDKNNVMLGLISLIACVYAGCAIYRIYVYWGGVKMLI